MRPSAEVLPDDVDAFSASDVENVGAAGVGVAREASEGVAGVAESVTLEDCAEVDGLRGRSVTYAQGKSSSVNLFGLKGHMPVT